MTKTTKQQLKKALKSAVFFAAYVFAFAMIWTIVCDSVKNEYMFPSLISILKETGRLLGEEAFYASFLASVGRVFKAFLISFASAAVFAVAAKAAPLFGKILAPVVTAFRALPTMAIILVLLVWSTPKEAPVIIAFLALFPILYTGIFTAFSAVDQKLSEMCKIYRVPVHRQIFKMYLPMSLPYILREAAGGLSFALKLVVSAEVLANTYTSLGGMLQLSRIYLETPRMFALTLLVISVGLILESAGIVLSRLAERRVR